MKTMYFTLHQNRIFVAIYEDYYITVSLFKTATKIESITGSYAAELQRSMCIVDGNESTKREFKDALSKARVRLEIIN